MSPLPSFVELMDSLGLSADSKLPLSDSHSMDSTSSHSRSPSASPPPLHVRPEQRSTSPTIIVSQYDAPNEAGEFKRRASSGNIKAARFSPYSSTSRRGSVPALADHQRDGENQKISQSACSRRSSSSSQSSDSDAIPPVPPLPARRSRGGSLAHLKVAPASCTPISSFARRRSPQVSPTSPTFAQPRARSTSADVPSPVMLPTLPPMLAESFASFTFPSVSNEAHNSSSARMERRSRSRSPRFSPMALDQDSKAFVKHHQAGLRISSFHRHVAPIA